MLNFDCNLPDEAACSRAQQSYRMIVTGKMNIGNTTA
jgi:hypothetical protein